MDNTILKNKRIDEIDFIRTICAIIVIIYHFSCHSTSSFKILFTYANEEWGHIAVTVFFIISGYVLFQNNGQIKSLKLFYYKRAKAIYPCFYICWAFFFLRTVRAVGKIFYAGNPLAIIYTILGIDGTLSQRVQTYYQTGEWFLGILIFQYLIYPLLLKLSNAKPKGTLLCLLILLLIRDYYNLPTIHIVQSSLISSTAAVFTGMLLNKYWDKTYNKYSIWISTGVVIVITTIKIPVFDEFLEYLFGIALFIVLFKVGTYFVNTKWKAVFNELGKLSYPMFLLQHRVILDVLSVENPTRKYKICILIFVCIVITIVSAKCLQIIAKAVTTSKIYKEIETKIIG